MRKEIKPVRLDEGLPPNDGCCEVDGDMAKAEGAGGDGSHLGSSSFPFPSSTVAVYTGISPWNGMEEVGLKGKGPGCLHAMDGTSGVPGNNGREGNEAARSTNPMPNDRWALARASQ